MAAMAVLVVATTPATAQETLKVKAEDTRGIQMATEGKPESARTAKLVPERIYTPPAGYRVAYRCDGQSCEYWLVENDTFYDRAVYASQVLWMSAVALLGLLVCLGLALAMFAIGRDVLRRDSVGTKKVVDTLAA